MNLNTSSASKKAPPYLHRNASTPTFILAGCSFLIIALFLYCGFFAVPSADDYAYANLVLGQDFWKSQLDSYIGWSSRYTATFFITWLAGYHLQSYWFIPWVTICLLLFSFSFLYWTVFYSLKRKKDFFIFPLSFFALYLSSSIAGHGVGVINEGFFWLSGAITYQLGAVFYFLFIAFFIWMGRNKSKLLYGLLASFFLILSMGSNETLMLLNVGTVIILLWFWRAHLQGGFFIISLITLVCFVIVLFAPGNNVRLATAQGHDFFSALGICVEKLVETYFYAFINPALWLFVLYFRTFLDKLIEFIEQAVPLRLFYLFLPLVIYCLYFPVAWTLDSGAPDRLVSFIGFISLLAAVFLINGLLTKMPAFLSLQRLTVICLTTGALLSPFMFEPLYIAIKTAPQGPAFHASHAARARYIRQRAKEGVSQVTVQAIEQNHLLLFRDLDTPDHATHYAKYHGVESVVVAD